MLKSIVTACVCLAALAMSPILLQAAEEKLLEASFESIEDKARGSEVRWYMFGGWAHVNAWVDGYVATKMKKRYNIDLTRVPMDAGIFVNKLLNEKAAGREQGSIDLVWINRENFKNAKEAGLLFGPFADRLPNVRQYVNPQSVAFDFGYPVEGYEASYGKAQFVFEYDSAIIDSPPPKRGRLEGLDQGPSRTLHLSPASRLHGIGLHASTVLCPHRRA